MKKNNLNFRRQNGITVIGWLFILMLLGMVALLALKIIPIYIEGFTIYSTLDSLKGDATIAKKSKFEIRKMLMKRLDINSIYNVTKDDIYITKGKGVYVVEIDYERRETIVGNMDIAVVFNKSIDVPRK